MSANRSRPLAVATYVPGRSLDLSRRVTPRSLPVRMRVPLPSTAPPRVLIRTAMLLTTPPSGVTVTLRRRPCVLLERTLNAGILSPGVAAAVINSVFVPAVESTVIVPTFVPSDCGTKTTRRSHVSPAASVPPAPQSVASPRAHMKRAVSGSLRRIALSVTGSVPVFVTVEVSIDVLPVPTSSAAKPRVPGTSSASSVAVPFRAIEIGGALELTVTVADFGPVVEGSKAMRTSHVPPTGTVAPAVQSFAPPVSWPKSCGSLIDTLEMGTASLPTFVIVAVCGALGPAPTSAVKPSVSGARDSWAWIPVPVRSVLTVGAFEGTSSSADLPPRVLGSNATLTVHVAFGWRTPAQSVDWTLNWSASAPAIAGVPRVTGPVPLLVIVTAEAAVGPAPMLCCPNPIEGGDASSARWVPVPERSMVASFPPPLTVTESVMVPSAVGSKRTRTLQLSPSKSPTWFEQSLNWSLRTSKVPLDGGVTETNCAAPLLFVTTDVFAADGPSVMSCVNVSDVGFAPKPAA